MDYRALAVELEECLALALRHPAPQGIIRLSRGEAGVLKCLSQAERECTPGDLRALLGVGSGRVADVLRSLERKGLTRRRTDPHDARRALVSITDEGRALVRELREVFLSDQQRMLEALGPSDAAEFVRLMRRVAEQQSARASG